MLTSLLAASVLSLSWFTGEGVKGSYVYSGEVGKPFTTIFDAGSVTNYDIDWLIPRVTNNIVVTTYDDFGVESDFSDPVLTMLPDDYLPFNLDPSFTCNTYNWYFYNDRRSIFVRTNGVENPSLKEPDGIAESHIFDAKVLWDDASGVKIGVVDNDSSHIAESVHILTNIVPDATISLFYVPAINTTNLSDGVNDAVSNGCNIILFTSGWGLPLAHWRSAFSNAEAANVLVIAAAPNVNGRFIDATNTLFPDYPAMFGYSNMIVVTGHDIAEQPLFTGSSNWFHIAAPARRVQVTPTTFGSGNSVAARVVAGISALALKQHGFNLTDTVKAILNGVDKRPEFLPYNKTSGMINAYKVLGGRTIEFTVDTNQIVETTMDLIEWIPINPNPVFNRRFQVYPLSPYYHYSDEYRFFRVVTNSNN